MKSGPLVSTSDEENGVDRFMPYITTAIWKVWPIRAQAMKRGRSLRRGQVWATRPLKIAIRSRKPSTGNTVKRMNMTASTPRRSSTCLTKAKFTPQANIVAQAAATERRDFILFAV